MNNIIKFPRKNERKEKEKKMRMVIFSQWIDECAISAIKDLKLSPEEVVAILANRTNAAINACKDKERIKCFAKEQIIR